MGRYISFFVMVAVGIALALGVAWVVAAPEVGETSPDTLRLDYKADYVLMIAEIYSSGGDLKDAYLRLSVFTETTPLEITDLAIDFASQYGYTADDLLLMRELSVALQSQSLETSP